MASSNGYARTQCVPCLLTSPHEIENRSSFKAPLSVHGEGTGGEVVRFVVNRV